MATATFGGSSSARAAASKLPWNRLSKNPTQEAAPLSGSRRSPPRRSPSRAPRRCASSPPWRSSPWPRPATRRRSSPRTGVGTRASTTAAAAWPTCPSRPAARATCTSCPRPRATCRPRASTAPPTASTSCPRRRTRPSGPCPSPARGPRATSNLQRDFNVNVLRTHRGTTARPHIDGAREL